jgi:hypothetical protein
MSLNHRHPFKLNASERRRYWRKADINQLTISAESAEMTIAADVENEQAFTSLLPAVIDSNMSATR